jgi:hypothetical protein
VDVQAVLGDAGVDAAVRGRAERRPADDRAVVGGGDEALIGEVAAVPVVP